MPRRSLLTTSDVIKILGGFTEVARLTGRRYTAVWMWGKSEQFPANTFLILNEALRNKRRSAPAWLWAMKPTPARAPEPETTEAEQPGAA